MAGIARVGDISTGHDGFSPRPIITGSNNVFLNGLPVVRLGDVWQNHCSNSSCHTCIQATGSFTTFVNGRPVARIGDATGCGDILATGSINVFSNQ